MTNPAKPVTPAGGVSGRTAISTADIVDANATIMQMAGEFDCLRYQAADWEPATTQVLDDISLQAGMRCLDVGSGVGAVLRIMAERIGPSGQAVGLDSNVRAGQFSLLELHRQGLHQVSVDPHALDTVGTKLLERPHPGPGIFGSADSPGGDPVASAREGGVDEDPGRRHGAGRAPGPELEGLPGVAAHVAHCGYSRRQPELELIIERLGNPAPLLLHVAVEIDEAGEYVFAGGVDLPVGRGPAGPARLQRYRIEPDDLGDGVPLDDNVVGTRGRGAVAVHDDCVPNRQAAAGPDPVLDIGLGQQRCSRHQEGEEQGPCRPRGGPPVTRIGVTHEPPFWIVLLAVGSTDYTVHRLHRLHR